MFVQLIATEESEVCIMCCFRQFVAMSLFARSENIFCDNDVLDCDIVSVKCCSSEEEQDLICSDITDLGLCLYHARKFPSVANLGVHTQS